MLRVFLLTGLFLLPVTYVYAGTGGASPHKLFVKMRHAARTLDYRATFVYQNSDSLSTLKVVHAWYKGKVYERLLSQDGARREVLVNGDLVTYVRPASKSVVIMHRASHPGLPGRFVSHAHMTPYYHLKKGSIRRIAGMRCRVLMLNPVDKYRYQHRMCISKSNGLPLESAVINQQGRPIERLLFTDVKIVKGLKPADFKPPVLGPKYTLHWIRTHHIHNKTGSSQSHWKFKSAVLPPGFVLQASQIRRFQDNGEPVRHLVLSDGIALVSVFITMHHYAAQPHPTMSHKGALNVMTTTRHGALVTVMGEVPKVTIKAIAKALNYSKNH